MQIRLRMLGPLRWHLPPGGDYDEAVLEVSEESSAASIIAGLDLPADATYLPMVNGEKATDATLENPLSDGDELTLVPPIKGG